MLRTRRADGSGGCAGGLFGVDRTLAFMIVKRMHDFVKWNAKQVRLPRAMQPPQSVGGAARKRIPRGPPATTPRCALAGDAVVPRLLCDCARVALAYVGAPG